jgi:putative heme-binding domain-containing protein
MQVPCPSVRFVCCYFVVAILQCMWAFAGDLNSINADGAYAPSAHVPWTKSRIVGTPDRPPAYALQRAYPKLGFLGPVSLHRFPSRPNASSNRLVVVESNGKVWSFPDEDSIETADLMLDFADPFPKLSETFDKSQLGPDQSYTINTYSLAFHPQFNKNPFVYVCYAITKNGNLPDGTHIARYRVNPTEPPTIDYDSETTLLRCEGGGHNGCTLAFGPDGYLYVSLGDASNPTPPDPLKTGQDISDLLSSILRIDVDRNTELEDGRVLNYAIPKDNPFVSLPHARGEVFAYGFRNPWRMSFDTKTGELWVGDVGWEAFEMVQRVVSGGNYGWSIKEGPGDVVSTQPIGPSAIIPPAITLTHADAASVTGGFVYHGQEHPLLRGSYVFGDWITRRFWSAKFDSKSILSLEEIAYGEVKPICFCTDSKDELLVLEYIEWNQKGGLYRFVENPAASTYAPDAFPTRLSQTGLFRDVRRLETNDGVVPYQINSSMWMEGARAEFHLAIPSEQAAEVYQGTKPTFDWFQTKVNFPKDTVLVKTYSALDGDQPHYIETQISHYGGPNDWRFYTYRWLNDQSDAELVGPNGDSDVIEISRSPVTHRDNPVRPKHSLGSEKVRWNFASRSQCRMCHTPWSGNAMGFLEQQLRRPTETMDSWRQLTVAGFIQWPENEPPSQNHAFLAMAGCDDLNASVECRARSYLHSNCAHCHQFGGNGSAQFDVRMEKSLEDMKICDAVPLKGSFELQNAKLVVPSDPNRSMLYYRLAKSGSGRMPHVGSQQVDLKGVRLLRQWIQNLPTDPELRRARDRLVDCTSGVQVDDRLSAAKELLSTPIGAMILADAIADRAIPELVHEDVLGLANSSADNVRDFLEPHLPSSQRIVRLGENYDMVDLLSVEGNSEDGRSTLLKGVGQCTSCHKIESVGKDVGATFVGIANKYKSTGEMLKHIVHPSLVIAPEYRSISILTTDGQSFNGRQVVRDDSQVTLMLINGDSQIIETEEIEYEKSSDVSIMPAGLLSPLTAQQARDILAYLMSQH